MAQSDPRRLASQQRDAEALKLRTAGASFQTIASSLGWKSPAGAYEAVKRALARVPQPAAEQYRKESDERLLAVISKVWELLEQGEVKAAKAIIDAEEARARILGFTAPQARPIDIQAADQPTRRLEVVVDAEVFAALTHGGAPPQPSSRALEDEASDQGLDEDSEADE